MFDHDEMKRLRFYEGLRFALAFALCVTAVAIVAVWCCGCRSVISAAAAAWGAGKDRVMEAHGGSMGTPSGSAASSAAADSFSADWRFGGFNGGGAKEVPGCQIGSLKVTADKLTYKWVSGGCEALGAKDKGDYSQTVACAFFWDGTKWVGGKFDWISTSRTSRSLTNIREGYHGWDAKAFFAAKRHGFCIVSKDGRRRSNFIED